ncbi:MAG: hypothetical protein RL172_2882 [Bacteroidota bacterium]|jgi:DNA-binding NtrC family response regulator
MKQEKKIFVVDDDPFWRIMLTKILKDLGYNDIVQFENGSNCLDSLGLNPSLVFLDYQMEDINGLEVLQQIKKYLPGIGVVFCTAHQDLNVAVNAMKFGSFDYLLKENASKKEVAAIIANIEKSRVVTDGIF